MTPQERQDFVTDIAAAVHEAQTVKTNELSDEEKQWVKLAIQAQAQRIRLRQAIIEKTLVALIWVAITTAGALIVSGLSHIVADVAKLNGPK